MIPRALAASALALGLTGCAGAPRLGPAETTLAPSAFPVDRSALETLTAGLRKKVSTLGLNGVAGRGGERISRALVLLPKDRSRAGVISFEIEEGPRAGVYQCEALGRGKTAPAPAPGWLRGSIGTTTIYYASFKQEDGATPPGIYDVRNISTATYELAFLNSPADMAGEDELAAAAQAPNARSRPYFSGVWKTWYPKSRRVMPVDLIWSRDYQRDSQGRWFRFYERPPKPKTEAARAFAAKQLGRNKRYYFGPFGRSGLANHTDRWDDPDRGSDPQYAGRAELADFRWRDTDGCLKVRADCLELLNEFVAEQARKGRRVQYEVRQTAALDAVLGR